MHDAAFFARETFHTYPVISVDTHKKVFNTKDKAPTRCCCTYVCSSAQSVNIALAAWKSVLSFSVCDFFYFTLIWYKNVQTLVHFFNSILQVSWVPPSFPCSPSTFRRRASRRPRPARPRGALSASWATSWRPSWRREERSTTGISAWSYAWRRLNLNAGKIGGA